MRRLFFWNKWSWRREIILLATIVTFVLLLDYFAVYQGEMYSTAREFVLNDSEIRKLTGQIQDINLPYRRFTYAYGSDAGSGKLFVTVKREVGSRQILIELKKQNGQWHVENRQILEP